MEEIAGRGRVQRWIRRHTDLHPTKGHEYQMLESGMEICGNRGRQLRGVAGRLARTCTGRRDGECGGAHAPFAEQHHAPSLRMVDGRMTGDPPERSVFANCSGVLGVFPAFASFVPETSSCAAQPIWLRQAKAA